MKEKEVKVRGEVEIILEDENGKVKHRELHKNTITKPILWQMLGYVLNTGGPQAVTKFNTRSDYSAANNCGIYLLDGDIDIKKETYEPPHLNILGALNGRVAFKNENGETVESEKVMTLIPQKVGYNIGNEMRYTMEYVKNTFKGSFKSILVAPMGGQTNVAWYCGSKDPEFPDRTMDEKFLYEATTNGTVVYKKKNDNTELYRMNLKTKEIETYTDTTTPMTSMNAILHGIVIGDNVYQVSSPGSYMSGNTGHILQLVAYPNWRTVDYATAATANANKKITSLEMPLIQTLGEDGQTVVDPITITGTDRWPPILVPRPDLAGELGSDSILDIIMAAGIRFPGTVNARYVIHRLRIKVDPTGAAPETISNEIIAEIPYKVMCHPFSGASYPQIGAYREGRYYLPFMKVLNPVSGAETNYYSQDFVEGVILDEASGKVLDKFRHINNRTNQAYIFVDSNEFRQMRINNADMRYAMFTRTFSGTNLEETVEKGHNDTLRVRYSYVIA